MQRNFTHKKNVYNSGRSTASQELIYQHMSNHYRRILNAKKVVDTSPPYCYKQKRPSSGHVVPGLPTARSYKAKNPFLGRNASPAATDRSVSTNSYSVTTGAYPSSRYHVGCIEDFPNAAAKKCGTDKHVIEVDRDRKTDASSYCENNWIDGKTGEKNIRIKNSTQMKTCRCNAGLQRTSKRRLQSRGKESVQKRVYSIQEKPPTTDKSVYPAPSYILTPKVLQSNAVSKLRTFKVYYPPRRKSFGGQKKSSPELCIECSPESPKCKCPKICVCESKKNLANQIKDQVQTSSRDSAYNGGVSSLPDSRSPTPDRRLKKDCACGEEDVRFFSSNPLEQPKFDKPKTGDKIDKSIKSRGGSPPEFHSIGPKFELDESLIKMKEDDLYTKFIEDITVEILEKCLYTNKALKKVMKKHIISNLQTLNRNRMLKEVDNLRVRLGIPEDQSLFDFEITATNSTGDVRSVCSVISDSEFVLPDLSENQKRKNVNDRDPIRKNLSPMKNEIIKIKSLSSGSENEGELISVIEAATKVNGKNKKRENSTVASPASLEYEKYYSDDSYRSSDESNRSKMEAGKTEKENEEEVMEEVKRQHRTDSGSSSEIEENISEETSLGADPAKKDESIPEQSPEEEKSAETNLDSTTCADNKKFRNVSFWSHKNNEGRDDELNSEVQDESKANRK